MRWCEDSIAERDEEVMVDEGEEDDEED